MVTSCCAPSEREDLGQRRIHARGLAENRAGASGGGGGERVVFSTIEVTDKHAGPSGMGSWS